MARSGRMKILISSILDLAYFPWPTQGQIRMARSSFCVPRRLVGSVCTVDDDFVFAGDAATKLQKEGLFSLTSFVTMQMESTWCSGKLSKDWMSYEP